MNHQNNQSTSYKRKTYNHKTFRRPVVGGYFIFFLTFPLIFILVASLVKGNLIRAIICLVCLGLFILGSSFVRKGIKNDVHSKQKKWKRSTAFPWKVGGSVAIGSATALCSLFLAHNDIFSAVGVGLAALAGSLMVYGLDPKYQDPESISKFGITTDEVIDALEEAEEKIQKIESSSHQISDLMIKNQVHRITSKAHDILHVIEEDPKDLRRARKFLKVYLDSTQKVITGYVKLHKNDIYEQQIDQNFNNVLNTIEATFNEQHEKLLENDILDLDVQIEVLEKQLKHEGVI